MLEDRSYMRSEAPLGRWSVTVWLSIILTVIFALQCIDFAYFRTGFADRWLAMTPGGLLRGEIWQLITFQFVHVGFLHLLGNVLMLWFIGRYVEQIFGPRRFLQAYFLAGITGGLLQGVLMLLLPGHYGQSLYGASAGTSGLFAIFAMIEAQSEVRLYFILPVKARVLLYVLGGISLFFTIVPVGDGVAHAAHLGGMLAGVAFVRWDLRRFSIAGWNPLTARRRKRQLVQAAAQISRNRGGRSEKPAADLPPEEFISREVDPILDKISAHGIHSLTPRERQILEAARAKMAKR
jgi:membrane associated rhomboid family serine protease